MRMSLPDSNPLLEKPSTKRYNWRKQTGNAVYERGCSMPTQEERITTLEQSFGTLQREVGKSIREVSENSTILLGLVQTLLQENKQAGLRVEIMKIRMDQLETKLDAHTALLNEHTRVLNEHTRILDEHTTRFDHVETRLDRMEGLLRQVLERLPQ